MTVNRLSEITYQFRGWAFKHYGHAINLQVYLNHDDFRNLRRELMYGPYMTITDAPHYFEFEGVVISWAPLVAAGEHVAGRRNLF